MEICAGFFSEVDKILDLINYDIGALVPIILLGDFKAFKNSKENMDKYWHKTLDYNQG